MDGRRVVWPHNPQDFNQLMVHHLFIFLTFCFRFTFSWIQEEEKREKKIERENKINVTELEATTHCLWRQTVRAHRRRTPCCDSRAAELSRRPRGSSCWSCCCCCCRGTDWAPLGGRCRSVSDSYRSTSAWTTKPNRKTIISLDTSFSPTSPTSVADAVEQEQKRNCDACCEAIIYIFGR